MMRSAAVSAALTAALLLPSCVPWPNQRIDREGVSGEVVDAASERPVGDALVRVSYGPPVQKKEVYQEERRTNSQGRYRVAQEGPWAWGYFIGPISGPVFGLTPDLGIRTRSKVTALEVSAQGYGIWRWRRNDSQGGEPPRRIVLERRP